MKISEQLRAFITALLRWHPRIDSEGKVEVTDYDLGVKLRDGPPLVELAERQEAIFAALERSSARQGRLINQLLTDYSSLLDIAAGQFYHSSVARKVLVNSRYGAQTLGWHQLDAVQKTPYIDHVRKRVRHAQA